MGRGPGDGPPLAATFQAPLQLGPPVSQFWPIRCGQRQLRRCGAKVFHPDQGFGCSRPHLPPICPECTDDGTCSATSCP